MKLFEFADTYKYSTHCPRFSQEMSLGQLISWRASGKKRCHKPSFKLPVAYVAHTLTCVTQVNTYVGPDIYWTLGHFPNLSSITYYIFKVKTFFKHFLNAIYI